MTITLLRRPSAGFGSSRFDPFGYGDQLSTRRAGGPLFPLIDMQFTVCSQGLEKKKLVSDSCPAEAWSIQNSRSRSKRRPLWKAAIGRRS